MRFPLEGDCARLSLVYVYAAIRWRRSVVAFRATNMIPGSDVLLGKFIVDDDTGCFLRDDDRKARSVDWGIALG